MFGKPKFYGSTTVGTHGQVVLPAVLRKELKINTGDKFLVLGYEHGRISGMMLVKAEALEEIIEAMNKQIQMINKTLRANKKTRAQKDGEEVD